MRGGWKKGDEGECMVGNVVRKMYIEFNDFRIRDGILKKCRNFFLKIIQLLLRIIRTLNLLICLSEFFEIINT